MSQYRLLDLFCGAGGCTKGYQLAGFYVVGVDVKPQPNYCGDTFVQMDALHFLRGATSMWGVNTMPAGCGGAPIDHDPGELNTHIREFDAIHASPPCQAYSQLAAMHPERRDEYPRLLEEVRELLTATGLPWVIENVEAAPMAAQAQLDGVWGITLCGSHFGLGVERGYLRRHRRFESNVPLVQPVCAHSGLAVGVYGHGGHSGKHRMLYCQEAAEAMDIDWMTRDEMTQAIPPAYTELIGHQLVTYLNAQKAEAA